MFLYFESVFYKTALIKLASQFVKQDLAVTKVNVANLSASASGKACTGVTINKITSVCHGMEVRMLWDATTDVPFFLGTINTNYMNDFSNFGGITNNAGAGKKGNIVFTT